MSRFFVAGLAAFALGSAAHGQQVTAQTLVDRAQIEDLLTRYYYNFGKSGDSMGGFYVDDAELILGARSYQGKAAIEGAYGRPPAPAANAATPAPAAPPRPASPIAGAFSFNVLLTNPLIVVQGDTATAQVIFTEILIDKQGDTPHLLAQGREYDWLVKVDGQWRFKKRQIAAGTNPPEGWPR